MINMLASSAVDRKFEPWSGQIKNYRIDICCFFVEHSVLRSKSNDWLAQIQENVSERSNISKDGPLFQ